MLTQSFCKCNLFQTSIAVTCLPFSFSAYYDSVLSDLDYKVPTGARGLSGATKL